jgi:hypothetical protein
VGSSGSFPPQKDITKTDIDDERRPTPDKDDDGDDGDDDHDTTPRDRTRHDTTRRDTTRRDTTRHDTTTTRRDTTRHDTQFFGAPIFFPFRLVLIRGSESRGTRIN